MELRNYLITFEDDSIETISYAQMYCDSCMVRFDIYSGIDTIDSSIWYGTWKIQKVESTDVVNLPLSCSTNLLPADGATDQSIKPILQWEPVDKATRYRLYFGTDNPPETTYGAYEHEYFMFLGGSELEYNTTYYWYVVPENDEDEVTGCESTVTSFTTGAAPTTTTTTSTTAAPTTTTTTTVGV